MSADAGLMGEEKKELIYYYKDPPVKLTTESGVSLKGENVDLEIILLGPKREQLKFKDKHRKRSTKLRELFSVGKTRSASKQEEDEDKDSEDEEGVDKETSAPKDNRTPVDESDDENYRSAEESKSDTEQKDSTPKRDDSRASRIPRIKSSSSGKRAPRSVGNRKRSDLLDQLESLFSSTDSTVRGSSGSNVDYMDYF